MLHVGDHSHFSNSGARAVSRRSELDQALKRRIGGFLHDVERRHFSNSGATAGRDGSASIQKVGGSPVGSLVGTILVH